MAENYWLKLVDRSLRGLAALAVIALIFHLGWIMCEEKVRIVKPIQFIGHGDEAGYAAMGESLANGQGLSVRYISWFFLEYSPDITRREDHWPPFMGVAIAPCFMYLGREAWVAKLPAIFFGSIGLPITTALLALALSRRGYVAIIAGLLMMAHPVMFTESLKTLSDVATAMLLAGFCWGLISAWRAPAMHLVAGLFLASAYYAKGSEIILLGLYPVLALIIEGPRVFTRRWVYLGMLTAILLMSPYWYSNWKLFNNPFHTTQNYVAGYMGLIDWEDGTYVPYWSGRGVPLPKVSDRWTKYGDRYQAHVSENREALGRIALTGTWGGATVWEDFGSIGARARSLLIGDGLRESRDEPGAIERHRAEFTAPIRPLSEWRSMPWELAGAGAVGLFFVSSLLAIILVLWEPLFALTRWIIRRSKRTKSADASAAQSPSPSPQVDAAPPVCSPRPPITPLSHLVRSVLALALVILAHANCLIYFWDIAPRFCFIFLPLIAALGCTGASIIIDWPLALLGKMLVALWRKIGRGLRVLELAALLRNWHVIVTLIFVFWLWTHAADLKADYMPWQEARRNGRYFPYGDQTRYVTAGNWIGANLPNAVVMARNPWELLFHCGPANKAVNVPLDTNDSRAAMLVFSVAKYYKVTHIYCDFDMERPGLERLLLNAGRGGLRQVRGGPEGLYEIVDYKSLPVREIDELFPVVSPGASSRSSAMR